MVQIKRKFKTKQLSDSFTAYILLEKFKNLKAYHNRFYNKIFLGRQLHSNFKELCRNLQLLALEQVKHQQSDILNTYIHV